LKRYSHGIAWGLLLLMAVQGTASAQASSEASIRKLLEVTESRKLVDSMYAQLDGMFETAMKQSLGNTELTPAQTKIAQETQGEVIALVKREMAWEKFEPMMIEVYRTNFTEEEVQGMLKFYESDVGRSMVVKMPAVMQSTMQLTQQRMGSLVPEMQAIQRKMVERLQELCKKEPTPNCSK
jgi:hypothetical protein